MGCGMSFRSQRNGLTALRDFQDEEAVFVQEERTRWERTKDWVSTLDDVPDEDMVSSKEQLGTWLCREMDQVLDRGERLSKGKQTLENAYVSAIDGGKEPLIAGNQPLSAMRREEIQEEMEDLMSHQERLMSMLFRVDAMRYQQYVQGNTGRLRWREAVQSGGMKRNGSTRGNARTIMFSVMKASRAALDGELPHAERLHKENSPEEWPKSEGSSSSQKPESETLHEENQSEDGYLLSGSAERRRQSVVASEGGRGSAGASEGTLSINRETQEAFAKLQVCMGARKNLRKEFNMLDSSQQKTITMNEFLFACYAMGTGLNKREITLVFKFIDTRGQGELSFEDFMAAFDLKSKLVRRMSQISDAGFGTMLQSAHQGSSMPHLVTKTSGTETKRRSFSMPTGSILVRQLEQAEAEGREGEQPVERSATTATIDAEQREETPPKVDPLALTT